MIRVSPTRPFRPFADDEKTRVIEGPGCIQQLGEVCRELGATRALVVSDPGVVAAGHAGKAMEWIARAGVVPRLFAHVEENPTTEDVARALAEALPWQPEVYVGVGGGSAIDVAKAVDFLVTCGGRMQDYWGKNKATRPLAPVVAVPTTAGTGSEVQSFALIGDPVTHQKMACGDPSAAPKVALLDPELSLTMPPFVTACTGLDTMGHAIESAVCKVRNERSSYYSAWGFGLAFQAFGRVRKEPGDLDGRARMLRASAYAGLAIEHSMLGAAHSLANPLTAHLGLPHGQAVASALPAVIEWNAEDPEVRSIYNALVGGAVFEPEEHWPEDGGGNLAGCIRWRMRESGMPETLPELRGDDGRIALLAAEASRQWTAQFNPRAVDEAAFTALLHTIAGE